MSFFVLSTIFPRISLFAPRETLPLFFLSCAVYCFCRGCFIVINSPVLNYAGPCFMMAHYDFRSIVTVLLKSWNSVSFVPSFGRMSSPPSSTNSTNLTKSLPGIIYVLILVHVLAVIVDVSSPGSSLSFFSVSYNSKCSLSSILFSSSLYGAYPGCCSLSPNYLPLKS